MVTLTDGRPIYQALVEDWSFGSGEDWSEAIVKNMRLAADRTLVR